MMSSQFGTLVMALVLAASFAHADAIVVPGSNGAAATTFYKKQIVDETSPLMSSGSMYGMTGAAAATPEQQKQGFDPMSLLGMLGGLGGGGDKDKKDDENHQSALGGSGELGSCEELPEHVRVALSEALFFRNDCGAPQLDKTKNIAINDYSSSTNGETAYMYIFDPEGKTCLKRTEVGYGSADQTGQGNRKAPVPCAEDESHATPPGFHVTEKKGMSGDYPGDIALTLAGLQGQGSRDRGILIHPAILGDPGAGATFGCSSVCKNESKASARTDACMQEVLRMLEPGSLVYNYFGSKVDPGSCKCSANTNGFAKDGTMCRIDKPGSGCTTQEGNLPSAAGSAPASSDGSPTSGSKVKSWK